MGNYKIRVQGVGCHHNGNPAIDADLLAKALVIGLLKAGHTINQANFVILPDDGREGSVTNLNEPEKNPPVGESSQAPRVHLVLVDVPQPVAETKSLRRDISALAVILRHAARKSRSRLLAMTKLEEAVMWLGKDLQEIDAASPGTAPNPYPHSKDPKSPVIDKADGDAVPSPGAQVMNPQTETEPEQQPPTEPSAPVPANPQDPVPGPESGGETEAPAPTEPANPAPVTEPAVS